MMRQVDKINVVLVVIIIAAVAGAVALSIATQSEEQRLRDLISSNNAESAALSNEISELQAAAAVPDEDKTERLDEICKSGDAVARLQSRYQTSSSNVDIDAIRKTADELAGYFVAGDVSTEARVPWPPSQVNVKCQWKFYTTALVFDDVVPCVWKLEEQLDDGHSGRVLGYALADYSLADSRFTSLEKHMTTYGAKSLPITEDTTKQESTQPGDDYPGSDEALDAFDRSGQSDGDDGVEGE